MNFKEGLIFRPSFNAGISGKPTDFDQNFIYIL